MHYISKESMRTCTIDSIKTCGHALQDRLQLIMSAQFAKQEAALKLRVAELEQKAATAGVA